MAGTTVDIGTGTTVAFGTTAFVAEYLNIDWGGIERPAIDTSHMGTAAAGAGKFANRTKIPGDLSDPGNITLEAHFNPEVAITVNFAALIDTGAETLTITWPKAAGDSTAAKWAASAFCVSVSISDPLEDKMIATIEMAITGNVTQTAAV